MEVVRRLRRLVDSMDDSVLNPSYKKRRRFLRSFQPRARSANVSHIAANGSPEIIFCDRR